MRDPDEAGIRAAVLAGICPWCRKGPYKVVAGHTTRVHGVDRLKLRELAGLTYSASICDPEVSEACRERGASPESLARIREPGLAAVKRKGRKLSPAAQELSRQKLAAVQSPAQRAAALAAAATPEARAKQRAAMQAYSDRARAEMGHGSYRRYQTGCRCEPCKAANAEWGRNYRAARKKAGRPVTHKRQERGGNDD
jgi:hypothetical protein